jgi:hypothetical protein
MRVSVKADERWWGGAVADGHEMPFGTVAHRRNLATSAGFADDDNSGSNQSAPLLVSSAGPYVWSDQEATHRPSGWLGRRGALGYDVILWATTRSSCWRRCRW